MRTTRTCWRATHKFCYPPLTAHYTADTIASLKCGLSFCVSFNFSSSAVACSSRRHESSLPSSCVCVYVFVCECVCVCLWESVCVCVYVYVWQCTEFMSGSPASMCVDVYVLVCIYTYSNIHVCVSPRTQTHLFTNTHEKVTNTRTHTHKGEDQIQITIWVGDD